MDEKRLLTKINLPRVFVNTIIGMGSGLLGTIVLGLILLLTWSIVGEVLMPTSHQATNEFGEVLSHKQETHPLFLSVVIWAVFMAALAANILRTVLVSVLEEHYTARATSITQVSVGNILLLLFMIPVYLLVSSNYGAGGVAFAALAHCVLSVLFSYLAMDVLALKRYLLVSLHGNMAGLVLFFVSISAFSLENPTILAFVSLPLLLGMMSLGNGLTHLIYFWFADAYGNDILDSEKRFGNDYGRKEEPAEVKDDFSQEFGEI